MLYVQRKDLYFNRKYDLHTINEEQKCSDLKALEFLLNLTVQAVGEVERRKIELKKICIDNGINNPLVGKE